MFAIVLVWKGTFWGLCITLTKGFYLVMNGYKFKHLLCGLVTLPQTSNLSKVNPPFHPGVAGIGSSPPPTTLYWLSGRRMDWMDGWMELRDFFRSLLVHGGAVVVLHVLLMPLWRLSGFLPRSKDLG